MFAIFAVYIILIIHYFYLGVTYHDKGNYEQAIAAFTKLTRIKPNCAVAYYNLGTCYGKKGEYNHSIANFQKAIQLKPEWIEQIYYNRGVSYAKKGERVKAITDFKRVLEISNDFNLRKWAEEWLKELGAQ